MTECGAGRLAVLLLDLDRFRVVNESLGPAATEQFLKMVAGTLSQTLRPTERQTDQDIIDL
jgi:GGDEF domain-containing protein